MRILIVLIVGLLSFVSFPENVSAETHNCDDGCTVVTCDNTKCVVWHCEAGKCSVVYVFFKYIVQSVPGDEPKLQGESSLCRSGQSPSEKGAGNIDCGQGRCVIKSCGDGECTVYGFSEGEISVLGVYEDTDPLLNRWKNEFLNPPRSEK